MTTEDAKEIIKANATVGDVFEKFNCQEASIDKDGSVWIAEPQTGHWLTDDQYVAFAEWLLQD